MTALLFFLLACPLLMTPRLLAEPFETPKSIFLLVTGYAAAWACAPPFDAVTVAALAWPVAFGVAVLRSRSRLRGFFGAPPSFDGLLHQVAYVVLFLAARALSLEEIRVPVTAAAAIVCGYGLLQVAGYDPIGWDRNLSLVGEYRRPFSTLNHPIHLGAWLAMATPLALSCDSPWRWPLVASALLLVAATLSRAAWFAMAAGMVVYAGLAGAGLTLWLGAGGVIVTAGLVVISSPELRRTTRARLQTLLVLGQEQRALLYREVWRVFRAHAATGVGPECLAETITPNLQAAQLAWRPGMLWPTYYTRAHSEPLHVLATTGVLGATTAAVFVGLLIVSGAARYAATPAEAAPLIAALVAYMIATSVGFHTVPTLSLAAVLAGVLVR